MKKILPIALTLLFINNVNAQSLQTLDDKKGFKDFTIGDLYSKWQNQLIYLFYDEKDSTTNYNYTGDCCNRLFDYTVKDINLKFKKNKLVKIFITTDFFRRGDIPPRTDDYLNINNSLSNIFGKQSFIEEKKGQVIYKWIGKKVVLFSEYRYSILGDCQLITITDYSYFVKDLRNNSGF